MEMDAEAVVHSQASKPNSKRTIEIHSKSSLVDRSNARPLIRSQKTYRKKNRKSSNNVGDGMVLPTSRHATQAPDANGAASLLLQEPGDEDIECVKEIPGATCSDLTPCDADRNAECIGFVKGLGSKEVLGKCKCGAGRCLLDGGAGAKSSCGFSPIDCKWSQWESWGPCDYSCGSGDRSRMREIITAQDHGGTCSGTNEETQTCHEEDCPTTTTMKAETTTAAAAANPEEKSNRGVGTYLIIGGVAAIALLGGAGFYAQNQKKQKPVTLDEFGEPVFDGGAEDYDVGGAEDYDDVGY